MLEEYDRDNPSNVNEGIKPSRSVKTGSSNEDDKKVEVPSTGSEKGNSTQKVVVLTPGPAHDVIEEYSKEILYEYECPSCGCGVSEEMTKCPACGAEFIIEKKEEEVVEYECPSCSASVTNDMTKCPGCDTELIFDEEDEEIAEFECPICGAYVTSNMTNCPICEVYLLNYIKFE